MASGNDLPTNDLLTRVLNRDERALARAISLLESSRGEGQALLRAARPQAGRARLIGITGAPGSGKSTLTDKLIGVARAAGERVAVLAVDPTSPFSGGAILGDRIRMMRWHQDRAVFIRSMATRGHLGGLAASTLQAATLLDASGFDTIFIETVGVGQSEVEIAAVADTTVVVLTPGQGDGVQAFKAGIMEVADIFALNKYDQPGGPKLQREVQAALELAPAAGWLPPIVPTVATDGTGIEELASRIAEHRAYLAQSGLGQRRLSRARLELATLLTGTLRQRLMARDDSWLEAAWLSELTPEALIAKLLD